MAKCFSVKMNNGQEIPIMGYGTWQSTDPVSLKAGLKAAIEAGYRHIDTAYIYHNEEVIGETLQELYDAKVIKREDIFLTTKIMGTHFRPHEVMDQLKKQLVKLRTSYVDLYLMHFPVPLYPPEKPTDFIKMGEDGKAVLDLETKLEDTWAALEKCVDAGLTRAIGVSNFNIKQTERMIKCGRIKPAMNQVESHPSFQNAKLIDFCQKNGVMVTGYSCFGSPGSVSPFTSQVWCPLDLLKDERIIAIGNKYGKTPAHVILRWQIQRGVVVIPKSLNPARIADNFKVWDFKLSDEDMAAMKAMDQNKRYWQLPIPGVLEHPEYPHTPDGASC